MKKILIIACSPLSHDGLTKIEMDIIRFNHDITFELACGYEFNDDYRKELNHQHVKMHVLPEKRNVFQYMNAIKKLVKKENYDGVYIHGNSAMMIMEVFPSKIAGSKRIITHCHHTMSDYIWMHYLAKPFFNCMVDVKIACSSYAAKWAYCGKRIYTIINGVDVKKFRFNEEDRNSIRKELGWSENFIVGHVGRLNKLKNHKFLIRIFKFIVNESKNARLLLIGDGELKKEIEQYIQELKLTNVVCIISHTDFVQTYMSAMDIMIMPSKHEGLCLVALEAQVNGLPLILSDNCAPETVVVPETSVLSLNTEPKLWAEKALAMKQLGHKDNYHLLKRTNVNELIMMKKIRKILINDNGSKHNE